LHIWNFSASQSGNTAFSSQIYSHVRNIFANSYEFSIFAIGLAMNQAVHID